MGRLRWARTRRAAALYVDVSLQPCRLMLRLGRVISSAGMGAAPLRSQLRRSAIFAAIGAAPAGALEASAPACPQAMRAILRGGQECSVWALRPRQILGIRNPAITHHGGIRGAFPCHHLP